MATLGPWGPMGQKFMSLLLRAEGKSAYPEKTPRSQLKASKHEKKSTFRRCRFFWEVHILKKHHVANSRPAWSGLRQARSGQIRPDQAPDRPDQARSGPRQARRGPDRPRRGGAGKVEKMSKNDFSQKCPPTPQECSHGLGGPWVPIFPPFSGPLGTILDSPAAPGPPWGPIGPFAALW